MIYTLTHDEVPGSVNAKKGGVGAHHMQTHREKMRWEGTYGMMLMVAKVPRNLPLVRVKIELQFTTPNNRRDVENFRHPITKPFADALVKLGYIPDDTEAYFRVEDLRISPDKLDAPPLVKSRMVIQIYTEEGEWPQL